MKTLLIAISLIGITTISGYAQNQNSGTCKNMPHHKVAMVHHKISRIAHNPASLPPYITVLAHVPNTTPVCPAPSESCFAYRQHNIVVEECPATIYKSTDDIQYIKSGTYMGYYPKTDVETRDEIVNPLIAPQHTVISNYRGVAPADGNSCNDCSPQ